MVEIAFERVQNPWVGGKMITESRDTIEGKKKKKREGVVKEETVRRIFAATIGIQ